MMNKFRLLVDGYSNGAVNMARDEALFRRIGAGESLPRTRLYQKPVAFSLSFPTT